jgi:hypothetical protein
MRLISEEYRSLNENLHQTREDYGIGGHKWADLVTGLAEAIETKDVLDYGCGKSTLAMNIPYAIKQYDPAIPKYSTLPSPADIVVCTDVLEHIEPEMIGEVLNHLQTLVKRVGFFVIATRPAKKKLADGRNAHLIIEPVRWWLNALWDKFEIQQFQLFDGEFLAVVSPKMVNQNA